MQTLSQLETNALRQPNSIEIKQALAEKYAAQARWEEAARTYQTLASLHMSTAALFIDRIRLGAAALMISSVLIFLAVLIQPSLSIGNLTAFAAAISSPAYLTAQLLFMAALVLYSCSAISIYKLLSYTRDHRPAFWGMVLSVIGVGLSMPALGIKSFVYPLIGKMFLEGETVVLTMYLSMNEYPRNILLGLSGYLVVFGVLIFYGVIWRNRGLSQPAVLLFLAGWLGLVVTGFQFSRHGLIMLGALVALGGVGFGLSLWNQASAQFDAGMDRSTS